MTVLRPKALDRARQKAAAEFRRIGRDFHARGWTLGTSGNFSAVVRRQPTTLAITATGVSKEALSDRDVLLVGLAGVPLARQTARPSAETLLHVTLVSARGAGAVLHTHSIWATLLSDVHGSEGGLALSGYEMLKGLEGIATHQHVEWLPILENDQDIPRLAGAVERTLRQHPAAHGFLLRRHGLYAWGGTLAEARRHVEIFEFLLEAAGRRRAFEEEVSHGTRANSGRAANVGRVAGAHPVS